MDTVHNLRLKEYEKITFSGIPQYTGLESENVISIFLGGVAENIKSFSTKKISLLESKFILLKQFENSQNEQH